LLARDLKDLETGVFDFASLSSLPFIDDFKVVHRTIPCLAGLVSNHPFVSDGRQAVTSQIFYMDPHMRAARTLNRWYRLGNPTGFNKPS
jgi:hypothetical protein